MTSSVVEDRSGQGCARLALHLIANASHCWSDPPKKSPTKKGMYKFTHWMNEVQKKGESNMHFAHSPFFGAACDVWDFDTEKIRKIIIENNTKELDQAERVYKNRKVIWS